jgi:hypothetical protein
MLTYYNNPELKAAFVANAKRHKALDLLVGGRYYADAASGCSVGCHARDLPCMTTDEPHAMVSAHYGIPEWLVHLEDVVFEGLEQKAGTGWHVAFAETIPVGVDLSRTLHLLLAWLLSKEVLRGHADQPTVAAVRDLHLRVISGGTVTKDEWVVVGIVAPTTTQADADSAVTLAAWAARAAAQIAATPATLTVARAAAQIADATPATPATLTVARAAGAVVRGAFWKLIASKTLELLREAQ